MEKEREIWYMEFKGPLYVSVISNGSQGISSIKIRFSGCIGSYVGQRWHSQSRGLYFYYGKGSKVHQLGTGTFVHHGMVSAVKRVECISDRVQGSRLLV